MSVCKRTWQQASVVKLVVASRIVVDQAKLKCVPIVLCPLWRPFQFGMRLTR